MSYFQDEFAGRIATKLMQTSLAVREVVMKLLDVLVYRLGLLLRRGDPRGASSDWRLALPFLVWLVGYVAMLLRTSSRGSARSPRRRPTRARR